MKRFPLITIWMLGTWLNLCAQRMDYRKEAENLNYQVNFLIGQLESTTDSVYYYNTLQKTISTALQCAEYDSRANKGGKIKNKYFQQLKHEVVPLREHLIDGACYYYRHSRGEDAIRALELYLSTGKSSLFKEQTTNPAAAYYAARIAYALKDYQRAEHYANTALYEKKYAKRAAEIKVDCMRQLMRTSTDSSKYVIALLDLHDKDPQNQNYLLQLIRYFSSPGHEREVMQFANGEVQKYPRNKVIWEFKGEVEMSRHNWAGAIAAFNRAIKIDSLYVPAIYNIGVCYSSEAQQEKASQEKDHGGLKGEDIRRLKHKFDLSRQYLEKAERLDPKQEIVQWAAPLYQVLYALDDSKAASVKPLIKQ